MKSIGEIITTREREMTDKEKELLLRRASRFRFNLQNLKEVGDDIFLLAGNSILFMVLVWLFIAWLVRWIFDLDYGWNSPLGTPIFIAIIVVCFGYTFLFILKENAVSPQIREKLILDIDSGKIVVEEYQLKEVKIFEELEHGGFFYFFLTAGEQVFHFFDHESQDLAIDGKDALASSFVPRKQLRLEKTHLARFCVNAECFGEKFPATKINTMTTNTKIWPGHCEFVDVSWTNLESKFAN